MTTKLHIFNRFMHGDSIQYLAKHYSVSIEWVESAIRKYKAGI